MTDPQGRPARRTALLVRGLVRLLELLLPPLLLFVLLNRSHQRMGDLAARTVVVTGHATATSPSADNAEEPND